MLNDIRLSLRTLTKNPGFTAVAVAMLAVGIGVNTTVFTVTNAILFKGFPMVKESNRLVYIGYGGCCVSIPDFLDYQAQAKLFEGMAVVHGVGKVLVDDRGYPQNLKGNENTAEVFHLVGAKPMMGRDFTTADEQDGAPPVAILSYAFWAGRYGKDPGILGRALRLNDVPTTIIGIMPEGFSFPQQTDVWLPLVRTAKVMQRENRDTWCIVARIAKGVPFESARTEIEGIGKRLSIAYPESNQDLKATVLTYDQFMLGDNAALIYGSMWGAVGFVLLIACANLANLLLARAMGRSREMSVRIALGAGRWRIIRQLLVESLMLSSLGGFLGWWLARWGVYAYQTAMDKKSSWLVVDYRMEHDVIWYLMAISIATGIAFGLAPALRLSRLDINTALKDGGRGATGGARSKRLSTLLVTGEIALAVMLLAGAGVMIRSFWKIHSADMGVDTSNMVIEQLDLSLKEPKQRVVFFDTLRARLEALPGVESVAAAGTLPSWGAERRSYQLEGAEAVQKALRPEIRKLSISTGYFHTLKAPLIEGRDFTNADSAQSAPVTIVNQLFAAGAWPRQSAIGKRIRLYDSAGAGPWITVVGISANIIQGDMNRQRFDPVIYVPDKQTALSYPWIMIRTQVLPGTLMDAVRQEVHAAAPGMAGYGPFLMADRLEFFFDSRFYGILFAIFAGIALLLASIGLYTVIAHSVSQRTQEIGVRMAVGAGEHDILKFVFRQGMLPLGIGLAIGLAGSLVVNRLLRSELVQVSPSDPVTLVVSSAVLIVAAVLGCLIPARRAMRVDPLVALRHE